MAEELVQSVSRIVFGLVRDFMRVFFVYVVMAMGRTTARYSFPFLSFGQVKVDEEPPEPVSYNWFGFRRDANGIVLLQQDTAALLGIFSWFLWLALVLAIVN